MNCIAVVAMKKSEYKKGTIFKLNDANHISCISSRKYFFNEVSLSRKQSCLDEVNIQEKVHQILHNRSTT